MINRAKGAQGIISKVSTLASIKIYTSMDGGPSAGIRLSARAVVEEATLTAFSEAIR